MYNRYYQEELTFLRELGREFAEAHPDAAHFLGDRGSDPDVERLLEGFAFLTGRLRQKLDDEFPELTHSLFGLIWPHYLRPLPAVTIVQFLPLPGAVRERQRIARGVKLDSVPVEGTVCRFATTTDVELDPLEVQDAVLEPTPGGGSVLRISLATTSGVKLSQLRLDRLRFFLAGDPAVVSALYALLSRHTAGIRVQSMARGAALASYNLPPGAVRMGGFSEDEALFPYPKTSLPGYRLLLEYFLFPSKFHFFELTGLEGAADLGGEDRFEIQVRFSSQPPAILRVAPENLQLACTPAVNLFASEAQPILVEHDKTEYLVRVQGRDPNHHEIYSIDTVTGYSQAASEGRVYPSFVSFLHGGESRGQGEALYHHVRMKPAVVGEGTESYLSFYSFAGESQLPPVETVSVRLTATNRRLPRALRVGDVSVPTSDSPGFARFRNITGLTPSAPPPLSGDLTWRLISHLSLNAFSLARPESLRSVLSLYNFPALYDQQASRAHQLRLEAIQKVEARPENALFQGAPARGLHTIIELSEEKFAGEGDMILFGSVLDEFLALYATLNSFTRLTLRGLRSGEVYSWAPRLGRQILL